MMKVLVIVNAHFGYDGISSVAKGYYKFLDHTKLKMDFLTINQGDGSFVDEVMSNGDKFYCLKYRNINPLKYLLNLTKIIRKEKYDIIHTHGNSATMSIELLAAKLGGVECRIAHSHNTRCDHGTLHKVLFPMFKSLHTAGFACSADAGEFLFPQEKFYVIKNGIDTISYGFNQQIRNSLRNYYGLNKEFVICNIGRLTYQKNQEFLIELLSEMNDDNLKLLLVGEGENREGLKDAAKKLGVENKVIFTGNVNNVNEILQAADMFAFPSRFEGLGIVAIEAQASNLPCLISDAVPQEVAITPNVKFVSLDDKTVWLTEISELKKNCSVELRETTAKKSLEMVANAGFDIIENCKNMVEIYRTLIG